MQVLNLLFILPLVTSTYDETASYDEESSFERKMAEYAALMKLSTPVGSSVLKTLHPEEHSKDYKMMHKFNYESRASFRRLERMNEAVLKDIRAFITERKYENEVSLPIMKMAAETKLFMNPAIKKTNASIDSYIALCKHENLGPLSILRSMQSYLIGACDPTNTTEKAETFAKSRELLKLTEADVKDPQCLPLLVMEQNNFNYQKMVKFWLRVKRQLAQVTYLSGVCLISKRGDKKAIDAYAKRVVEMVDEILNSSSKWMTVLETAWPNAHKQVVLKTLENVLEKEATIDDDKHLKINFELLKEILPELQQALANTGNQGYMYQVFIARANAEEYQFFHKLSDEFCFFQKGIMGWDVVTCRSQLNTEEISQESRQSLSTTATNLNRRIKKILLTDDTYDAPDLDTIVKKLGTNITDHIVGKNKFSGFIIVRKWAKSWLGDCPKCDSLSASYPLNGIPGTFIFDIIIRGGFTERCEHFCFAYIV